MFDDRKEMSFRLDPILGRELAVRDVRKVVADVSAGMRTVEGEANAFRQLTRNRMPAAPFDPRIDLSACQTPSDGAALGTYFKPKIIGFNNSTSITWRIVAPRLLGGSSKDLLFVTSSNQASKGCEALVRYYNDQEAEFRVWDWAHPEINSVAGRFVVIVPFSQISDYLITFTVNGTQFSGVHVVNQTSIGVRSAMNCRNEVFLLNGSTGTLDRFWSYDFDWDTTVGCKFLFFGPCIEPKGFGYGTTNTIGYAEAVLTNDVTGKSKFDSSNSRLVARQGFDIDKRFNDAHHTVLAD